MGLCESTNSKKILNSQIFFNINHNQMDNKNNNYQNYKMPVKLEFTLENCEVRHKYQIGVIMTDSNESTFTEIANITQKNITFNTCYICDYFFERQQYLNINLMKDNMNKGNVKVALGNIVGSPNSTYRTAIGQNNESIIISAQSINDTDSYIDFDFKVKSLNNLDFGDINNKISYKITNGGRTIYQSESISSFGSFEPIRVPLAILEPSFTISFLNCKQEVIAYNVETIGRFTEPKPNDLMYLGLFVNKSKIEIYNNSKIFRHYSFIDYLKNGVTIKLSIGIDFTSSNKQPLDPTSLHYLGGGMNDYELAIRACGSIVAYYDYNQLFPVYGFGAAIKGENKISMCFNVNFKNNPQIYTIDNVIKEYHNCFNKIILAGPTEFCPLIKKVNETIKKENDQLKYHILMILTDGIIVDQQQTIDALVEGSFLPLSVIIIGIGNDHFQEMIQLDGDDIPLVSSIGIKRMRDLVQFVPYNKYRNDPTELAAQVLEEVPRQIMEYYTMNNIYPDNLAMFQLNKNNSGIGGKSINVYENTNNTYKNFMNGSVNTYKNYMNFSNSGYKNSLIQASNNQNYLSNSKDFSNIFEDERESRGTGAGSIYY